MKLQLKKRRLIPVALAILVLVVGSGVAYAFWTSGGSGTGGGSVANPANNLTVAGAPLVTAMYPGAGAETTSVTITNNATASVHVTTVSISGLTSDPAGCTLADFTIGNPATIPAESQNIAGSSSVTVAGPTIQFFNDPARSQDACKGVTVTLSYSVS